MPAMIDLEKSHQNYRNFMKNKDFNLKDNLEILLNSSDTIENEEIVARYVINLLSITDMLIENKDNLSKSQFMLQVCKNHPFLSSIEGEEFVYVAKGTRPSG